jgi:hypothetical protein
VREVNERRSSRRQPYRNGYYEGDFVTRLRIARTGERVFCRAGWNGFSDGRKMCRC